MHFEGRELQAYAEPVLKSALREGSVYFSVNFVDDEMLIPVMQPLVFIGCNLETGDANQVYFQDVQSYYDGVRYDQCSENAQAEFQAGSEAEMNHIFDFEKALEVLMRCSLRRSNKRA